MQASSWIPNLLTAITTIAGFIFGFIQTRKLRAAEAEKANAEASTVAVNQKVAAEKTLTEYADALVKDRVRLSSELDAAHDFIRQNEQEWKKKQLDYEAQIDQLGRELEALKKRVESLEHIDKLAQSLKALESYPKFTTQT